MLPGATWPYMLPGAIWYDAGVAAHAQRIANSSGDGGSGLPTKGMPRIAYTAAVAAGPAYRVHGAHSARRRAKRSAGPDRPPRLPAPPRRGAACWRSQGPHAARRRESPDFHAPKHPILVIRLAPHTCGRTRRAPGASAGVRAMLPARTPRAARTPPGPIPSAAVPAPPQRVPTPTWITLV